jgi:hypothetical protein
MVKVLHDNMAIVGHQLTTIASIANATLTVQSVVTESIVPQWLLVPRDKNELSKKRLAVVMPLSAVILYATEMNAITTFQNVIITKILLLLLMSIAAAHTNASVMSTSVQTLVIVHVQKAMNELSSAKIVVQLPSVSHVITLHQQQLPRQRQQRPQLSRLQLPLQPRLLQHQLQQQLIPLILILLLLLHHMTMKSTVHQ